MLDRFKVPDEDKIYVPVEKITEVTQNILKEFLIRLFL